MTIIEAIICLTVSWPLNFVVGTFFGQEKKHVTMKKTLALLIATGAFMALHAQSREQTRDAVLGRGNNGQYSSYPNNARYNNGWNYEMDRVNRDCDSRINSIRYDRRLNNRQKERLIHQLEIDRQNRLNDINRRYSNDRYERHDNGKHKGWYKGKGNPHRE